MFLLTWTFNWVCHQHLDFQTPTTFSFSLFNLFIYRRYFCCVYIMYPISPVHPIYPIYPIYRMCPYIVSLFLTSYHFMLSRIISVYFFLFRQSLVPQKSPHGIHVRCSLSYPVFVQEENLLRVLCIFCLCALESVPFFSI